MLEVLDRAGFAAPHVVPEQQHPDPDFPTVAFPNPEEPGAMDLAMALASQVGADLVVANDPDADRCAAAVEGPHGWRMLRGDEVGALLGDHLLRSGKQGVYAASIVSSSLLGKLAAAAGQEYAETLTGFKWIGRVPGLAFGYEEALGYCVDPVHVKDKDGVSALLMLCDIAARAKAEGRTLTDLLDDIAVRHGLHATDQLSARVADLSEIPAAMARLRETPPVTLGGLDVLAVDDLSLGSDLLPPTDGLRYRLADGARVIVRPSGTEPKIKCYLEVVVPVEPEPAAGGPDGSTEHRRRRTPRCRGCGSDRRQRPARRPPQRHQGRRRHLTRCQFLRAEVRVCAPSAFLRAEVRSCGPTRAFLRADRAFLSHDGTGAAPQRTVRREHALRRTRSDTSAGRTDQAGGRVRGG